MTVESLEYAGLGYCEECDWDERPGVRLYRPRITDVRLVLAPRMCRGCWERRIAESDP